MDNQAVGINSLPDETVLEILSWLDIPDLGKTAQVCHHWARLSSDNYVWRKIARNLHLRSNFALRVHSAYAYDIYKRVCREHFKINHKFRNGKLQLHTAGEPHESNVAYVDFGTLAHSSGAPVPAVISSGLDGRVCIWHHTPNQGLSLHKCFTQATPSMCAHFVYENDDLLVPQTRAISTSADSKLFVWSLSDDASEPNDSPLCEIELTLNIQTLLKDNVGFFHLDSGGRRLIGGSRMGHIIVLDVDQRKVLAAFRAHRGNVQDIALVYEHGYLPSSPARWAVTCGHDDYVRVWDIGQLLTSANATTSAASQAIVPSVVEWTNVGSFPLCIAANADRIAVGWGDSTVRLYDLRGALRRRAAGGSANERAADTAELSLHTKWVTDVAMDESEQLLSCSAEGVVALWDAKKCLEMDRVAGSVAKSESTKDSGLLRTLHITSMGALMCMKMSSDRVAFGAAKGVGVVDFEEGEDIVEQETAPAALSPPTTPRKHHRRSDKCEVS